jgi:hypothetical protein
MKKIVTPYTKFSELFEFINGQIEMSGFVNIDFMKNLGHTIEIDIKKRSFIDRSNHEKIGTKLFTFEPHIRKKESNLGFKHEEIYYFNENNILRTL